MGSEREVRASYIRNFIFGVEDSLVSAVGMMSGIALAGVPTNLVLVTGVVYIFVEAFSMAAGSYLSERSGEEFAVQHSVSPFRSLIASTVMFFSYLIAGIIPIAPYAYFAPDLALTVSILGSLIALFVLGMVGARAAHTPLFSRAFQMMLVGGIAILLGIAVGKIFGVA